MKKKNLREPWLRKETSRSNFRSENKQQIQKLRMLVVKNLKLIQEKKRAICAYRR